jgi:hypothetical protein
MPIVTRTGKGSKLTIAEMDGNLEYLASSSFQNGLYTSGSGSITITETSTKLGFGPDAKFEVTETQVVVGAELSCDSPVVFATDQIVFSNLPQADPVNAGQLWIDSGSGYVLKVSQG